MRNPLLDALQVYPFDHLRTLLADTPAPEGLAPITMTFGEPQHQPPPLIAQAMAESSHLWNLYVPTDGTPSFRATVGAWLQRRYNVGPSFHPDRQILPMAGAREGLFMVGSLAVPPEKRGRRPLVVMPNPFYLAYPAAAAATGAESLYLPALPENNYLPDVAGLPPDVLERVALVYVCSPVNPQGTVASMEYWQRLFQLAREYDFVVVADESYAEIYDREPPPGALEAAAAMGDFSNLLAFHSLSKRSSAPGLRSGFIAGDPKLIAEFKHFRSFSCVFLSLPVIAASEALWRDETHVVENRRRYQRKLDMAEELLGGRFGFYRPPGGFFLWLNVGDGEAAAKRLWAKAGLRVVPGGYLAREIPGQPNPGAAHIRVALVHDEDTTREALTRIARHL